MIDRLAIDFSNARQAAPLLEAEFAQQSHTRLIYAQQYGEDVFDAAAATALDRVVEQARRNASAAKVQVYIVTELNCFPERRPAGTIRAHRTPTSDLPRNLIDINREARIGVLYEPFKAALDRNRHQVCRRATGFYRLVVDCNNLGPVTLFRGPYRHVQFLKTCGKMASGPWM